MFHLSLITRERPFSAPQLIRLKVEDLKQYHPWNMSQYLSGRKEDLVDLVLCRRLGSEDDLDTSKSQFLRSQTSSFLHTHFPNYTAPSATASSFQGEHGWRPDLRIWRRWHRCEGCSYPKGLAHRLLLASVVGPSGLMAPCWAEGSTLCWTLRLLAPLVWSSALGCCTKRSEKSLSVLTLVIPVSLNPIVKY